MKISVEMGCDLASVLTFGKKTLQEKGIDSWAIDCDLLMMKTTGYTRAELVTKREKKLTEKEMADFLSILERRICHEPIQYILNHCEFMGLEFYIDKHVLIPRPDTEYLAEAAINYLKSCPGANVLDMCTGSGCIAVSLAFYSENINCVWAADISQNALKTANKNSVKNQTKSRIKFIETNMFEKVPDIKFDLIVSNPPYIPSEEINGLMTNVKDYEPINALDGGADGLYFYKIIAEYAGKFLKSGGHVLLEIGYNQKESVTEIFKHTGYDLIECIKDIAGLDRVLVFSK